MMSGGSSSIGYMERYEAKARTSMAFSGEPEMALATACRMAHVVKTLVERPRQVATVNGLNRKLDLH